MNKKVPILLLLILFSAAAWYFFTKKPEPAHELLSPQLPPAAPVTREQQEPVRQDEEPVVAIEPEPVIVTDPLPQMNDSDAEIKQDLAEVADQYGSQAVDAYPRL